MAEKHLIVRPSIKAFAQSMESRMREAAKLVVAGDIPHHRQMSATDLLEGARRNLAHFDPESGRAKGQYSYAEGQAADVGCYLVFILEREKAG